MTLLRLIGFAGQAEDRGQETENRGPVFALRLRRGTPVFVVQKDKFGAASRRLMTDD